MLCYGILCNRFNVSKLCSYGEHTAADFPEYRTN